MIYLHENGILMTYAEYNTVWWMEVLACTLPELTAEQVAVYFVLLQYQTDVCT